MCGGDDVHHSFLLLNLDQWFLGAKQSGKRRDGGAAARSQPRVHPSAAAGAEVGEGGGVGLERRLREVPVRYMVNDRPWPWLGPSDDPPPPVFFASYRSFHAGSLAPRASVLLLAERTAPECTWSSSTCTCTDATTYG